MVKDTPIIVADEPTGNLDSESAREVLAILKRVAKDKLVVMVTHNIEQVEEYATRIIKMHDGRIIENNEIKIIENETKVKESRYKNLTLFNKYRLGIRNTFNIFSKFALLFLVFFFMSTALIAEYGAFRAAEEELEGTMDSMVLRDVSKERILIKKQDKTAFTDEDFAKIEAIQNIDYIVQNDIFIDAYVYIQRQVNDEMMTIAYSGTCKEIESFKDELDDGRIPQSEDEIVISLNKDNYQLKNNKDEILNNKFTLYDPSGMIEIKQVTIVGIVYNEKSYDYNSTLYVSKDTLNSLRTYMNKYYSKFKILANNKYQDYAVVPSDKVLKGRSVSK